MVYQDDRIIVLHKPAGLSCQMGTGVKIHLEEVLPRLVKEEDPTPIIMEQFITEKDVSGIIVLARHKSVVEQFKRNRWGDVKKEVSL